MPPRQPPRSAPRLAPPVWRRPVPIAALVVAAVVIAWGLATRPPAPPALDHSRNTIVFLGDSITSGHGLPLEVTFPHRIGQALRVDVRNAGISGDRTAGGLARLERDVLAARPKLVVLELGVNDAFGRLPPTHTLENLRAIIRRLREDGIGVLLVHIDPRPLAPVDSREMYRLLAREEGTWLVEDFLAGVAPDLTTDGLHPNEAGHARLAAKLEPLLREILALK